MLAKGQHGHINRTMRITKHDTRHLGAGRPRSIVRKTGELIDQEIVSLATGLDLAEDSRWSMSTFSNQGKPKSLPA